MTEQENESYIWLQVKEYLLLSCITNANAKRYLLVALPYHWPQDHIQLSITPLVAKLVNHILRQLAVPDLTSHSARVCT